MRLTETHHHLDGDERVQGRVTDVELARDGVAVRQILRVPSGAALSSSTADDCHLEDPWTGEPVTWNGEEFLLTIRPSAGGGRPD